MAKRDYKKLEPAHKAFCIAMAAAIKDEMQAPIDYKELIGKLNKTPFWVNSKNESNIRKIIGQEEAHKVTLSEMHKVMCQ